MCAPKRTPYWLSEASTGLLCSGQVSHIPLGVICKGGSCTREPLLTDLRRSSSKLPLWLWALC